ncbi:MAG: Ig-like domain-containing protein [Bacilli bacterium]|nr:Ig-like domain-containing protein [Bacilli bacterium]
MYTEYDGQSQNGTDDKKNNNTNKDDWTKNANQNIINQELYHHPGDKESKENRFLGVVWKILLVAIVFITLFLSLIQFGVISLASSAIPNAIVFNQNEIGMKRGTGYQLVTTVLPANAENKQVVYESSDPSVATVNEVTGYIKALKNGTAVITARTLINDKKVECKVNVGDTNITVSNLSLKEKIVSLAAGYTSALSYNVTPSNATEINFNFSSSDTSIATVDEKGVITAVKEGTVNITVATNNNVVVDQATVTVYNKGTNTVVDGETVQTNAYPVSVSIPTEKSISVGAELQLPVTVSPSSAISTLSFTSSNPNVATVTNDGVVKAIGVGSTDIVAKTINGITAVCHVTVGNFSISLKKIHITTRYSYLQVGQKKKLYVSYEPTNASNPTITWSSSDSNIVSVDGAGNIIAKAVGRATITATTTSSGVDPDTIEIEVGGNSSIIELKTLSIGKASRDLFIGSTEQITPVFDPKNATYTSVTYTSSDSSVASVDSSGKVLGIKEGQATITVKANRSSVSASTIVNVKNNPSQSVELSSTDVTLTINDTFTLNSKVLPTNASIRTVTYTSSNPSVATVDQLGIIRGVSAGTTTITVTPNGGGSPSTCLVTVR